jgi:hypothetical protein
VRVAQIAFRKRATPDRVYLDILVDGRLLLDLVREAESESAANEGHPDLAGAYGGLPWTANTTGLLLGEASGISQTFEADQAARITLLICECGESGCWPLQAMLKIATNSVTWSDFRQPHRKNWDYSKLGPFSFDKAQYLTALEDARRS